MRSAHGSECAASMEWYSFEPLVRDAEGFGKPFYTGSASFDVVPNETADVALHCKRVNVALSLDVDESFSSKMSEYKVIFHSEGGGYFDYTAGENELLYLRHGEVEMFLHFTLADGRTASVLDRKSVV